jgi:thioredoxin reductase (NADPH)
MSGMTTEVVVIGAGPVGLFSVFALGQVGLRCVVVDALHEAGGQCAALYPEKPIYDIPGRRSISAADLIGDLMQQAQAYAPTFLLGKRVETLRDHGGRFELGFSDGSKLVAGAVLVAAGAGAFGPNRPPIENIEAYEGRSVFYSVRVPERFRGKRVVIAGGGDSAADWAVILADIAASVTIVHRRKVFRAAPATVAALERLAEEGRVTLAAPRTLQGIEGEGADIRAVTIANDDGHTERLPADALLCFYGLAKDLSAISSWGLDANRGGIPVDPATMAAGRHGVFAVGDIANYPGKLKLILTGFAEAASAAHAARAHIHPERSFHFEYSTTRGQPSPATVQEEQR